MLKEMVRNILKISKPQENFWRRNLWYRSMFWRYFFLGYETRLGERGWLAYTFHTYTCLKENLFVLNDTIHLKNGCFQLFFSLIYVLAQLSISLFNDLELFAFFFFRSPNSYWIVATLHLVHPQRFTCTCLGVLQKGISIYVLQKQLTGFAEI